MRLFSRWFLPRIVKKQDMYWVKAWDWKRLENAYISENLRSDFTSWYTPDDGHSGFRTYEEAVDAYERTITRYYELKNKNKTHVVKYLI